MAVVVGGDRVLAWCQAFQRVVTVTITERTELALRGFLPGSDADAGDWLLAVGLVPEEPAANARWLDL